jgi:2-oxoisovalerate dehydrogenase E1 component beta subunit
MVVVHEAPATGGFGAELAAAVQARAFASLQAPILRVCGFDTPFPYSLEDHYLPSADRILEALMRTIEY